MVAVRLCSEPYHEAWLFNETKNEWQEMNTADAMYKAKLLSKETFEKMYPDLPPLPAEAFKN